MKVSARADTFQHQHHLCRLYFLFTLSVALDPTPRPSKKKKKRRNTANIITFPTDRLEHPKLLQDFDEETHDHQHRDHLQSIQTQHPGRQVSVIALRHWAKLSGSQAESRQQQ